MSKRLILIVVLLIAGLLVPSLALTQEGEREEPTEAREVIAQEAGTLVVQPFEIAVVFDPLRGELLDPLGPGTHAVMPPLEATIYAIAQREYTQAGETAVEARTFDGQAVGINATVLYSLDPNAINQIHVNWQDRFESDFVRLVLRAIIRDVVAQFRATEIYGEARAQLQAEIEELLAARFADEGLLLTAFLLRDLEFSAQFIDAIEQRQLAEIQAQQAQIRAEQARTQSLAQREQAIARADTAAQAAIIGAEAEAEVLRRIGEQIAANPLLIQYLYVTRLADNTSVVVVPSSEDFTLDLGLPADMLDLAAPEAPDSN
ncbi:MAG: prohibitin family protein [Chloroflexi bacterium]|nr:prohibitin family protein [Chloroflexota bacterium]